MEIVYSEVKCDVAKKNETFTMALVEKLMNEQLQ
jgi:hypothetical protein